jgi:serine/threonine protein kinase
MDKNNDNTQVQNIKLLNQGTFGCVFKPGPGCNGQPNTSKEYITKIQKPSRISLNEVNIGKKVQTIPNYEHKFAPIIDNCEVNLSEVANTDELNKCNIIDMETNEPIKYETNIMKYAGDNTLYEYFDQNNSGNKGIERILHSHIRILTALNDLTKINIVHFDLKQNNIICKPNGKPIIIDFGISIDLDKISSDLVNTTKLQDHFYAYGPDYEPWCIDIAVISKIVNVNNWQNVPITMDMIMIIINDIFEKNQLLKMIDNRRKRSVYKSYIKFFNEIVHHPPIEFIKLLLNGANTWDNYSIACIMYKYLYKIDVKSDIVEKYILVLLSIIMSIPGDNNRPPVTYTRKQMRDIFSDIRSE